MDFGADVNAHTSFFDTIYDIVLPIGDKQHLEEALTVFNDYADGALLLPEEIEKERGVVLAEKRSRDSSGYRTFLESIKFELPNLRIASRMPIGKEKNNK